MNTLEEIEIRKAVYADRQRFIRWLANYRGDRDRLITLLDFIFNPADDQRQTHLAEQFGVSKQYISKAVDRLRAELACISVNNDIGC